MQPYSFNNLNCQLLGDCIPILLVDRMEYTSIGACMMHEHTHDAHFPIPDTPTHTPALLCSCCCCIPLLQGSLSSHPPVPVTVMRRRRRRSGTPKSGVVFNGSSGTVLPRCTRLAFALSLLSSRCTRLAFALSLLSSLRLPADIYIDTQKVSCTINNYTHSPPVELASPRCKSPIAS